MSSTTTTTKTTQLRTQSQPKFTVAALKYYKPLATGEAPWVSINWRNADGSPESNFGEELQEMKIHNIRTTDVPIGIDVTGFDMREVHSKFSEDYRNFENDDLIKREYYPEVETAIKHATGGKEVFIFDHTIRRRNPGVADDDPSRRQPVPRVHIDQTPSAAQQRVRRHLGDRAEELLQKRFQLINFWRPIQHPAEDHPLAVCSYNSIDPKRDLVATKLIYPDPIPSGETYNVLHHAEQQFFYTKAQTTQEATFIKCYDSDGSVAGLTPHTAFNDPNSDPRAPMRQSIEVRCLVFHD